MKNPKTKRHAFIFGKIGANWITQTPKIDVKFVSSRYIFFSFIFTIVSMMLRSKKKETLCLIRDEFQKEAATEKESMREREKRTAFQSCD